MPILRQIAQLGQPVLRQAERRTADHQDSYIQSLIDDLLATMNDANGVGIAAPQVYEPLSLFILAPRPNARYPQAPFLEPTAVLNPRIIWVSDETEKGWEGCLSVPGLRGLVPRHTRIRVRYQTRCGDICEVEYADFIARVFQHEFDHLQGMVFLDRVEDTRELISEKEYFRLLG